MFKNSGCIVCLGCRAWGLRVRNFSPLGWTVEDFLCLGQEYATLPRSGIRKWGLAQFGPEMSQRQHFFKDILTGSRRSRFPRIMAVVSVLDCLPSFGDKSTRLFPVGPDSRELFESGSRVHDFLALRKPKMGLGQFGQKVAQSQQLLTGNLAGRRGSGFSGILGVLFV